MALDDVAWKAQFSVNHPEWDGHHQNLLNLFEEFNTYGELEAMEALTFLGVAARTHSGSRPSL